MGSHSWSDNCQICGWEHATFVEETRPSEAVPDEWGYCLRCGYNWGINYRNDEHSYNHLYSLSELNRERIELHNMYVDDGEVDSSPFSPPIQYNEQHYRKILDKYHLSNYIDELTFSGEGHDHHEHEHHHHHDEMDPDDLIDLIDRLAAFAVDYTDAGGFGGEPLGSETDEKRGFIIDTILYVEGSIELNIIYDLNRNPLSLRFSWTDNDYSPIIYLPPPEFLATSPDEIMEHDH